MARARTRCEDPRTCRKKECFTPYSLGIAWQMPPIAMLCAKHSTGFIRGPARRGGCCSPRPLAWCLPNKDAEVVSRAPDVKADDAEGLRQMSGAEASTSDGRAGGLSYSLMAGLASAGVLETAYLTVVFGVPLSLLGMLAYGAVGALAATASARHAEGQATQELDTALITAAAGLAGVSSVLMYLLATRFAGEPCAWCYLSAIFSFSILGAALAGMPARTLREATGPGLLGAGASVLVLLASGLGAPDQSTAEDFELPYSAPVVTTESSPKAKALAKRLKEAGARMYGAFWCSHCFDQKQTFGKEAMGDFPYVECYPDGWKRGVKLLDACEAAGVRAFPTWVINGATVEGELTLDALEARLDGKVTEAPTPPPKPRSPFADN